MVGVLFGALSIGLTLGILGSGGSIITVPVLAYLVGQEQKVAIAGSLVIVGIISAVAALQQIKKGNVDWRSVFYFGLPGMAGTYLGAFIAGFVSGSVQFVVFALIMLMAAWRMLAPQKSAEPNASPRAVWKIVIDGIGVGAVTGFVGIGGGFLIVPALVLLGGLSMSRAVATSLVIIAMNSASGYVKYQQVLAEKGLSLDWQIIGIISAVGIVGSVLGGRVSQHIPQDLLKKVFAVFLLFMAAYIGYQSIGTLLAAAH
jgi:uncharacterized membrane protein YfcA